MKKLKSTLLSNINNTIPQKGHQLKEFKNIPIEWGLVKIQDIISLEYGKGLKEDKRDGGKFPVVGSAGVVGCHSKSMVKGPGIVIGRKGSAGLAIYIEDDFWAIDTTYYVKPKIDVNLKWLFSIIDYMKWSRLGEGTVPGLNRSDAYQLYLPLSSLKEQNEIAEILSTVDADIEKTDAIIKETEKLKKELIKELVFKGIGHKKYKKFVLGPRYLSFTVPEDWSVVSLGKLAEKPITYGVVTANEMAGGYPMIRSSGLHSEKGIIQNLKYIDPADEENYKRTRLEGGEVLMALVGATIGQVGITPKFAKGFNVSRAVGVIKLTPDTVKEYFLYYLMSEQFQKKIMIMTTGSAQPVINLEQIRRFPILVPSKDEQIKIASIILEVADKLKNEQSYKSELQQLKQGLLQGLLTGKVRVKV